MDERPFSEEPEYYDGSKLSDEAAIWRRDLEERVKAAYAELGEVTGIRKVRLRRTIETLETRLAWQGANPKEVPFADLKEHVQADHGEGATMTKYRSRIKNRATAIRAYCIQCQGGEMAGVRECVSICCPLYPFRMGKDPLRGFDIPNPNTADVDEDETLLDNDDNGDDSDAS